MLHQLRLWPMTFADKDENEEEDESVTFADEDEYDDEDAQNTSADED